MANLKMALAAVVGLAVLIGYAQAEVTGETGPSNPAETAQVGGCPELPGINRVSESGPLPSETFLPGRAGYYETVWPSEHTDLWRSHAALDAGLPADFDPKDLKVSKSNLNLPTWGYTRNRDEIFILGGSPFSLNIFTRSIKLGRPLTERETRIALLENLFNRSVPYVAKIRPHSMQSAPPLYLDQGRRTVNYTGGLLMHQNGFIYAVSQAVLYKIDPSSLRIVRHVKLPLVGFRLFDRFWTTYNGMQVTPSGKLILKGFYLLGNPSIPGWLLLIDPDDLSFDVKQKAFVASARMTIGHTMDGMSCKTWLYHVNATKSLRFEITETAFKRDDAWTRTYRMVDDGSTQGSSHLLFGEIGQVLFANNTAPTPTTGIELFAQPTDAPAPPGQLTGTPAFEENVPGFNFFMVAGDPFLEQIVVYYDPINNLLAAHKVGTDGKLTFLWEHNHIKVSASPAISPDRDLLYVDDYREGRDHFVVLRLSTGQELARVQLDASLPTIGTIFLGMNDDVYIISSQAGRRDGLVSRIFVQSAWPPSKYPH